ncbi:hypothetical protein BC939DRAFT_508481 [Gamsiella multidivaricata]|uniref:uncharacterized protein n=1 Tax=Gamsiella multidivaricata TaxID=101098 RepID=UPI00221EF0F2|nr:uncharacterized protein BC939DRAFT_508481 [Gamsiella multidivaricata]KAI7816272.1 hypothetical protein BC939DRAFT_508481 [Gamsiella multidivaricata]
MDFICVCRKLFLTRDRLSKHYKRVCAHSNNPINVSGLQLIDSAQVLPDDLEVVNAPGTSDDEVDEENNKGDEAFRGSNPLIFNNNDITATSMTFDLGRVVGATIRKLMRGLGIANIQQQHAQRMQITAFQEQQRKLITAMEQRILSSIAQTAAGQEQGQAMQAASASASDTGPSSPVSTSRKRMRSDAPHFGTFRPPSCMSPIENK